MLAQDHLEQAESGQTGSNLLLNTSQKNGPAGSQYLAGFEWASAAGFVMTFRQTALFPKLLDASGILDID